jgi:hypothetical protein
MKGKVQSQQQKNISYRSYKNFDVDIFNSELIQVAFPDIENIETSEQVNNAYIALRCLVYWVYKICLQYIAPLSSLFIQGSGFFLGRLVLTGACLFSICMKETWYCM